MLIVMNATAAGEDLAAVETAILDLGLKPLPVSGPSRVAICVTDNHGPVPDSNFAAMRGVAEVIRVSKPYKLVSREVRPDDTVVQVGDTEIGRGTPVIIAGPCSVETESRTIAIARQVKAAGAAIFRAGAFKPRTSPYSFQGLGNEGLETLHLVRKEVGIPVVTEVTDSSLIDEVSDHVDMLQIGARNMQNYCLLRNAGRSHMPVLLKRGLSATLEEWLMAAEYILSEGNPNVVLCERGIRSFSSHSRNTLDLNVVPLARDLSHLPVIVDPSHGVGHRGRVRRLARASLACGAQGLMIEAHTDPNSAYSDAAQTVDIVTLTGISRDLNYINGLPEETARKRDGQPCEAGP